MRARAGQLRLRRGETLTPLTSPAQQPLKVNQLFRLPIELLIIIAELVNEAGQGPYLARVSRALVPVARHLAFHKVTVTQPEHLRRLCDIVGGSSPIAESVVELELDFVSAPDEENLPPTPTFIAFLGALVHLEHLSISNSSELAAFVLSSTNLASCQPKLRSLAVALPSGGPPSSFQLFRARRLDDTRSMDDSIITSISSPRHRDASICAAPLEPPPVQRVSLTGPLHLHPGVASFFNTLVNAHDIGLHATTCSYPSALPYLLRALPSPTLVTSLSLSQPAVKDPTSLAGALARFSALETLELGRGTWCAETRAALEGLERLVELRLPRGADVQVDELRELVCARSRLEHIELDVVTLPGEAEDASESSAARSAPSCTLDDLLDLVPLAAAHGVELGGPSIMLARAEQAMRTEREAERARAAVEEERGASLYFSSRQCSWP